MAKEPTTNAPMNVQAAKNLSMTILLHVSAWKSSPNERASPDLTTLDVTIASSLPLQPKRCSTAISTDIVDVQCP
jgi:hypothetical protein